MPQTMLLPFFFQKHKNLTKCEKQCHQEKFILYIFETSDTYRAV